MDTRAAIYTRISSDRLGKRWGVDDQRHNCLQLIRERGWTPLPFYEDNDVSAWNGKLRPAYERLLADVAAGRVDVVVVLHPDRLHRLPEEFEQFRRTCVGGGVTQLVSCYGDVDLTNPDALLVARVMTATAAHQSDSTSRRVKAMHRRLAREGRFAGGPRAFGWTWKRADLDPTEAAEVRQAAASVLAGTSLRGVVADLNEREVRCAGGGIWTTQKLRKLLLSPHVAGLRDYEGSLVPASWPAILDRETWDRLRLLLTAADRRRYTGPAVWETRYVLSGLAVCALCGQPLKSRPTNRDTRAYACPKDRGGCGRIRRRADWLEDFVRDAVMTALDSPEVVKALRDEQDRLDEGAVSRLLAQLRQDQAALEELSRDYYVDRRIDRAQFHVSQDALTARVEATERELAQRAGTPGFLRLPEGGAEAIRAAWDAADVGWRRSLLATVVDRVVIHPVGKGGHVFRPEAVEVRWRV